jgi:hypothetical protein
MVEEGAMGASATLVNSGDSCQLLGTARALQMGLCLDDQD